MTAESTMIHDAASWRATAARLALLRDDVAALTRQVAALDVGTCLGDDPGGRRAFDHAARLQAALVDSLALCAGHLGAHAHEVRQGSRRIIDADSGAGLGSAADTAASTSVIGWKTLAVQLDSCLRREPPPVVDELLPGRWPQADSDGLARLAAALRSDARRLIAVGGELLDAGPSRGRAADAMSDAVRSLARRSDGVVLRAARSMIDVGAALAACACAASATRDDMATIGARVDLDRARGRLLAQLGGEPALVEPAAAGRLALSASAEDYRGRVEDIGRRHEQPVSPSAGGTASGLGAMVGGVGGAMVGASAAMVRPRVRRPRSVVDVEYLRRRAEHLAHRVPATLDVRMSVGCALTDADEQIILVATSDDHDYLRPGITLESDETFCGCGTAPELTLLDLCAQLHVDLAAVASTTPAPEQITEILAARAVRIVA